jgi:hypothetical protein
MLRLCLAILFLGPFSLFSAYLYFTPDHPVSIALFKVAYEISPTRRAFLEFYSPVRRDVSAGSIPLEIDQFLCGRVEQTTDAGELAAIVNLYEIQAGWREGQCIYNVSDASREKIAAQIVADLDNNERLSAKFTLLEEIRRGESIGKGGFAPAPERSFSTREEWLVWTAEAEPIAKAHFQRWWNSGLSWEEKKKIAPLQGTGFGVHYCCG